MSEREMILNHVSERIIDKAEQCERHVIDTDGNDGTGMALVDPDCVMFVFVCSMPSPVEPNGTIFKTILN